MVSTTRISGKTTHGSDLSEYQALVGSFPPRPIRDKKQLRQTWVRIESLLAQAQRSRAEDDYLSLLSDLVEHWEAARVKMPTLRGVELIRELLEENSLPQRALVDINCSASILKDWPASLTFRRRPFSGCPNHPRLLFGHEAAAGRGRQHPRAD